LLRGINNVGSKRVTMAALKKAFGREVTIRNWQTVIKLTG